MEVFMTNKTITHEVKLQKSVIIILGVMAFGLCANVFAPTLSINDAFALGYGDKIYVEHSGRIINDQR